MLNTRYYMRRSRDEVTPIRILNDSCSNNLRSILLLSLDFLMHTKTFDLSTLQPESFSYDKSVKFILHYSLQDMLRMSDYFMQMDLDELNELEKAVRQRACFGWLQFDKDPQEIHCWLAEAVQPLTLVWFIGHEVGHLIEDTFRKEMTKIEDPLWREECMADNYALAASLAFEIYKYVLEIRGV